METQVFEPSRKYLTKSYVTIAIVTAVILLFALFIDLFVTLDETYGTEAILWAAGVAVSLNMLWGVPALLLTGPPL